MEVKMNKEIRDYQESMFMGLDLRQCVCSVLAILTAIGIYFGMRDITGQEVTGWLCVIGAAPFAACGFFKYHGMTAEQFLWAVIKSELLYPKKLVFQSEDLYHSCIQETISLGEKNQKDGAEILKERERKAEVKQGKKQNTWEKEYPAIVNDPKIVWTLYNTGYLGKNGPHSKPKGGALSDYAMKSYEEMGCLLE